MTDLMRRAKIDPWLSQFFDVESMMPSRFKSPVGNGFPAVNIAETDKDFQVDVVAPGYNKEDFKVQIEDDALTISAEKKSETSEEDKEKQYSRREYSYSSFTRSFRLPENAQDEAVSAEYKEGILKLIIPKTEEQQKVSKQISVN